MGVNHGVGHTGCGVYRHQSFPEILFLRRECFKGRTLVREVGAAAILWRTGHVVGAVGEGGGFETAIVVPLRANAKNALAAIVRAAENVPVTAGCCGMHAVGGMDLAPAPPFAGFNQFIGGKAGLVLEYDEPAICHFLFQGLDSRLWQLVAHVGSVDLNADRVQWLEG